jgi:hypothetical protein
MAHRAVLTRAKLRDRLSVQNERMGVVLESLERAGQLPSHARRLAASRLRSPSRPAPVRQGYARPGATAGGLEWYNEMIDEYVRDCPTVGPGG